MLSLLCYFALYCCILFTYLPFYSTCVYLQGYERSNPTFPLMYTVGIDVVSCVCVGRKTTSWRNCDWLRLSSFFTWIPFILRKWENSTPLMMHAWICFMPSESLHLQRGLWIWRRLGRRGAGWKGPQVHSESSCGPKEEHSLQCSQ